MTTDVAETQVECDLMHLSSCSIDEFSVKGGRNGVKGRLKPSMNFWVETLDAPDFVLDMIRRGYRLQFAEFPIQCFLKNNRSALQHPKFVAEAISGCIVLYCIVLYCIVLYCIVLFCPFCVNPLTPSFQGSTLNLPPPAAAALTPWLRIGETRTTGFALL